MKKEFFIPLLIFFAITAIFFHPIFKGHTPFPGDLLVGGFAPYNSHSYLGYAPGGVPHKGQGFDVIRELLPWKHFVIESLKNFQIPFWTPYNFSGNPLMANFQSAVFYPLNLIFFLLPFINAWSIFIFLAPFLAGIFTYIFLRELKVSKIASIFGGVSFAFSSYMTVWLEYGNITHTFMWLPLVLFFTEKLTRSFRTKYLLLMILTLWFSFLGGYIQGYFYILITTFLYFFAKVRRHKKGLTQITIFSVALLFPALLALFQLLPTLELFQYSSRSNYTLEQIEKLLNPWWYTITVVAPDFFGHPATRTSWLDRTYIERVSYFGVIPFIFALAAAMSFKKRKEVAIFSVLFIITFFVTLDILFMKYLYRLPLPLVSTTVPTRILGLFGFCGSILAAFAMDFFLQRKEKKNFLIAIIFTLSLTFLGWAVAFASVYIFPQAIWTAHIGVMKRGLIIPTTLVLLCAVLFILQFYKEKFVSTLSKQGNIIIPIFLVVITMGDLFYFFHKITPFSPQEFVYPRTDVITYLKDSAGINRFWGYGSAYVSSNFQTFDHTFSPEGDDPLHLRSYTALLAVSKDGKMPDELPRPDANVAGGYGPSELKENRYRQKILNIVGVKYVLNKDDSLGEKPQHTGTFDEEIYKLAWQKAPWQAYENLRVVPRAFLTNDYLVISDERKTLSTLLSRNFNESKTIILSEDPHIKRTPLKHSSVTIVDYQPNKVTLQAKADSSAMLFLSDNYFPGWLVTIDGKDAKVYKADNTFRAVALEKGNHRVIFSYYPKSFDIGWKLSAVFLILLFVGVYVGEKKRLLM